MRFGALLLAVSCGHRIEGDTDHGHSNDSTSDDTGTPGPPEPDWSAVAGSLTDFGGVEVWFEGKPAGPVGFWAYDGQRTVGVWAFLNVAPEEAPSNGGAGEFQADVAMAYTPKGTAAGVYTVWGNDVPLPCDKSDEEWDWDFMLGTQGTVFLSLDGSGHGSMRTEDVMATDLKDDFELQDIASPDLTFERCDFPFLF